MPTTSSESAGAVPTVAAGQSGEEEDVIGVVGVSEEVGLDVRGVGSDGGEAGERGE